METACIDMRRTSRGGRHLRLRLHRVGVEVDVAESAITGLILTQAAH